MDEWLFAWFKCDHAHFASEHETAAAPVEPAASAFWTPQQDRHAVEAKRTPPETVIQIAAGPVASGFTTPVKAAVEEKKRTPPKTPSQHRIWRHSINTYEGTVAEVKLPDAVERHLCTSPVLNAYREYDDVVKYIYSALTRMSQVQLNYTSGVPRCLFKLSKGYSALTFHPIDKLPIDINDISGNRFPRADVEHLLAIEDLGRGSSGRAWLMCTTSTNPGVCVLKFLNKSINNEDLLREKIWWDRIYPEFTDKTKVEMWGGAYALMMPHFSFIREEQQKDFETSIRVVLQEKFENRGYVHGDVKWRNIGCYLKNGELTPVVFDLEGVCKYKEEVHRGWIDNAIEHLFRGEVKGDESTPG